MKAIRSFLIGCLLATGAAYAQLGNFKMPTLQYNPGLLFDPNVKKDMNISDAQSQKLQTALITAMKPMMGKPGAAGGTDQMIGMVDTMQKTILPLLSPSQRTRLHQITLQSYGPKALADPKVGAEVGLSAQQQATIKHKLETIAKDAAKGMQGKKMGSTPQSMMGNMGAVQELQKKINDESIKQIYPILTAKQRATWTKLQGRPITLSPMFKSLLGG